ncbi:MAG: hypothetical protein K8R59_06825 [Thermoanaerobaculales bacterium]|nr:hypothetical protein [Thermoanaerobaculales bacterium]
MNGAERFLGGSLDECLNQACLALGARTEELQYEVIEDSPAVVTIEAALDPVAVLGLFLREAFNAGDLDIRARIEEAEEHLGGELYGEDFRLLTAGLGKGLDSLQYLCNRIMNGRLRSHAPVHLDGDGFKMRRAGRLQEDAEAAAERAIQRRGPVTMGPFTPAARREIHLALADHPSVETASDGEGFLKQVVVRPFRLR